MNEPPLLSEQSTCHRMIKAHAAGPLGKHRTRKLFQLCSVVLISVILIFYARFLITSSSWLKAEVAVDRVTTNSYGRRIRSLASTSAIDHEVSTGTALTNREAADNGTKSPANCTSPAINEFPPDGFTRQQRQHGWICLHILISLYCFWLLAVICDEYFLPAIEEICLTLSIQKDVMGATIMAAATSSPELFMNCVGTFVTKGDIGIGTIVGSSVFNILAVPACCGLFVGHCVRLDWWPVSRDCLMYCAAVCALICTIYDGKVMWYEALALFVAYFFYMTVMYYNDKVARSARQLISKYRRKLPLVRPFRAVDELTPLMVGNGSAGRISKPHSTSTIVVRANTTSIAGNHNADGQLFNQSARENPSFDDIEMCQPRQQQSLSADSGLEVDAYSDVADSPWRRDNSRCMPVFVLRWPITLLLWLTVPDSRKHPHRKYLTFLLSMTWIALISYLVAYAITIIGNTLSIPDSVMGLTILSAGMSVPEAVSSVIVTKQGHSAMGISNAIGSNTFDILLCLSVPWFIKAYFLPNDPAEHWVELNSTGLTYSVVFLLTTLLGMYVAFLLNGFTLNWKIGLACALMYVTFIVTASLIELNVFFPVNLPRCEH